MKRGLGRFVLTGRLAWVSCLRPNPFHEPILPQPVFRFAPSPYGRMHLGNAYSALMNEKLAREAGGRLLLRIEDTDQTRARPEFVQGIFDDLQWLGIQFETPVRIQSEHMADYRASLDRLDAMGLLYKCTCTRAQLAAAPNGKTDPEGAPLYPQTCRRNGVKEGEPFALRLKMDEAAARISKPLALNGKQADPSVWGDVVLARKDTGASYHLAVVVDDGLQGVTHVVRGRDVAAATSIHLLLQKLLGLPRPHYHHHDLIMRDTQRKLSKSHGDPSLRDLREGGMSPRDVRAALGFV
jgi:glutamyl-Q tRNA(Asp) synthetase